MRNFCRAAVIAAAAITGWMSPAVAQDYPTKTVRFLGASSPGGTSDVFMRALQPDLQKKWQQPVIVENRAGASFNLGIRACVEAPPDGYTVCVLPGDAVTQNPILFKNLGYDPSTLEPVAKLFVITGVLAVNSNLNVATMSDLQALMKQKSTRLSYTSPNLSTALFMEKLKQEHNADIVQIGFKGGSDATGRMLSGEVPLVWLAVGNLLSAFADKKAYALVVDTETRSSMLPNVPTLREIGYKGDITSSYFGAFAPPRTPKAIIEKISRDIGEAVNAPEFKNKQLIQRGLEPAISTPAEYIAFLQANRPIAERVIRASGLEGSQ